LLADAFIANPSLADWLPLNVNSVDDVLIWAEKNRRDPVSHLPQTHLPLSVIDAR